MYGRANGKNRFSYLKNNTRLCAGTNGRHELVSLDLWFYSFLTHVHTSTYELEVQDKGKKTSVLSAKKRMCFALRRLRGIKVRRVTETPMPPVKSDRSFIRASPFRDWHARRASRGTPRRNPVNELYRLCATVLIHRTRSSPRARPRLTSVYT